MAACVLCRRVPRLRYLPGFRKDFTKAQHVPVKQEDGTDDHEGKKGILQPQEASPHGGYTLHYNPSSYHRSVRNSATSRSQTDNDEDEQFPSTVTPSFWQQSNRYTVSCSRRLSSSRNTLLDLAFNKDTEPQMPPGSQDQKNFLPDIEVDTRAFIKCRPEYASITLDLSQRPDPIEWEEASELLQKVTSLKGSMSPSDVSHFLRELGRLQPDQLSLLKSDHRFLMLLRYSVEHLRLFDLPQLLELLRSFVWLDMPHNHPVMGLYGVELSRRGHQMTLHELLLAADLLRCVGRQVPQFLQHLFPSVRLNHEQIGVAELVHLVYIMGESRNCERDLINIVERLLLGYLQQLHPDEVGAVCLGLFKSQTSMSESAVTRLVDKAHSFVEDMSDLGVVNVLKYLRYSYLYHKAWLQAMAWEVPRRAPEMGVQGLMHVSLACSALHYHNDNILMAVAERVPSLVPHCRSKDSCKLLWAFGTLMFLPDQSPSLYPSLTEALRMRKAEFQQYPEHLLTGLLGLAFVSQFPEDLITLALSPDYVNLAVNSTKLELKKDLFTLDEAVARELPEWSGPRLSCELREEVAEMLWKFAQSDICLKPEVLEAEAVLQDLLGGEEFVWKRMILPHTRSIDLEVHFDSTGQPIPVNPGSPTTTPSSKNKPKFPSHKGWGRSKTEVNLTEDLLALLTNNKNTTEPLTQPPTSLHKVEPDEGGRLFETWRDPNTDSTETAAKSCSQGSAPQDSNGTVKLAIQVSNRNHYCYQSQVLLGLHAMKRRQLKLAGYRVVEVSHHEWFPMLRRSWAEKLAHLHSKIYSSLQ